MIIMGPKKHKIKEESKKKSKESKNVKKDHPCFSLMQPHTIFNMKKQSHPTRHLDVVVTSQRRLSVRPSDVAGTSQMKHPTTSQWNVAKTSQWYVFTTSYWYVVMTSHGDVMTTSHQYVSTTSQTSLK